MKQKEALQILKTGANVFLTGEPGSGKTHTINEYVAWLRSYDIDTAITASTGIAATHIGGLTVHAWSGIGVKRELSDYDLDKITQNERVVKRIRATRVLIIDEISMLSAATLAMVDAVCRTVRHKPDHAFGGMQVVLVGDFFQLPPVVKQDFESAPRLDLGTTDSHTNFAFASSAWRALNPLVCYLSEQHRQEDKTFLSILGAIRAGTMSETHRAHLQKRMRDTPQVGHTALFPKNADVDRINSAELARLIGSDRMYHMTTRGTPILVDHLKRGCLSPETLILKVGARVMFTRNHIEGQYVNGTTGVVTGFDTYDYAPIVKTQNGKNINVEKVEWTIESEGKILAGITQYPLRLAWAITVHKSQGVSLDSAVVDLSQAFEYGQGYVALSRVRTLKGLFLLGINKRAYEVHPEVRSQDAAFRSQSDRAQRYFAAMDADTIADLHATFVKICRSR